MTGLILAFFVAIAASVDVARGQSATDRSATQFYLSITGSGTVVPYVDSSTNGAPLGTGRIETLVIGQNYHLLAVPARGYAFAGWQSVNMFENIQYPFSPITFELGEPIISYIVSVDPKFDHNPSLSFSALSGEVLNDTPDEELLGYVGYQANFVPIPRP